MFLLGSSRKSWKTQPIRRRSSGIRQVVSRARSLPATWILPSVGRSSLSTSRRNVDLPEPEGPTRKMNSPFSTSMLTFSSAGRLWLGYSLVTLSKWITDSSHAIGKIGGKGRDSWSHLDWPRDSLGRKLASKAQHRRTDRAQAGRRDAR